MSEVLPSPTKDSDEIDEVKNDAESETEKIEIAVTDLEKNLESRAQSSLSKKVEDIAGPSDTDLLETKPDNRNVRRIIAEDPEYNLTTVPELELKSLNKIIDNFAFNATMYTKLRPSHKKRLLQKLSLDVPLQVVTSLIEDGIYWQRKSVSRWPLCDVSHYGRSWKRLFLERNLEEIIERFVPDRTDRTCLEETLTLSAEFVHRLVITEMLPPIKVERQVVVAKDDASDGDSDIEEAPKIDHLNLDPIVSKLGNLTELCLMFDVKNCGVNFEWNIFQFTVNDCLQLAKCVAAAKQLKVFHLNRSRVDCDRCRVLISHLLDHPSLIELDFSHNHIGDRGARALGKMINNRSQLQCLRATNNMIRTVGAQALGFALLKNTTLQVLDIRLNRILDDGGQAIAKALLTNTTLREINLAGNGMTEPTAAILAQVVQNNTTLISIDLSNNNLGPDGGKQIQEGMADNRTILSMDMRFTECGDEAIFSISQIISYNQKLKMYASELDEEIKMASPYIIADQHKAIFGGNETEEERMLRSKVSSFKASFNSRRTGPTSRVGSGEGLSVCPKTPVEG